MNIKKLQNKEEGFKWTPNASCTFNRIWHNYKQGDMLIYTWWGSWGKKYQIIFPFWLMYNELFFMPNASGILSFAHSQRSSAYSDWKVNFSATKLLWDFFSQSHFIWSKMYNPAPLSGLRIILNLRQNIFAFECEWHILYFVTDPRFS